MEAVRIRPGTHIHGHLVNKRNRVPEEGLEPTRPCASNDTFYAGGRTRTDMSVTSLDFESSAYTNFATPARRSGHDNCPPFSRQLPMDERPRARLQ